MPVYFGIDHLLAANLTSLQGLYIGLVTNDAATTARLPRPVTPTRLALQQAGVKLVKLFAPEHGLGANTADGAVVGHTVDRLTGAPVYSLYGATYRPTPQFLADLDVLLFDIPDIGARFYTYIWTLSHVMEACAAAGLPLWVLDRPNPLSGDLTLAEGPLLDEVNLSTFVGRWSMPIRHSLTVGELARLWNAERQLHLDLTVIRLQGWQRSHFWPATGLPFVPTSPGMPSYEAALVYPGTCLFEGTNLSEGRGTSTPFQLVGAPWFDSIAVADAFNALNLPGVAARGAQFTPAVGKFADQPCQGVMLHTLNPSLIRPVAQGLHLLALIKRFYPREFSWLPYPTAANEPGYGHFDRLIGRLEIRKALDSASFDPISQIPIWTHPHNWAERVAPFLLYK